VPGGLVVGISPVFWPSSRRRNNPPVGLLWTFGHGGCDRASRGFFMVELVWFRKTRRRPTFRIKCVTILGVTVTVMLVICLG